MRLRAFNDVGIKAFRKFLADARQEPTLAVPFHLLEDDGLNEAINPLIDVEPRRFAVRRDAAEYLCSLLHALPEHDVMHNSGLWTWLTLFYFDEVCPIEKGCRSVKNDYAYVFEPNNSRHFYRHRLYLAWYILTLAPTHNRLFLSSDLSSLDKYSEEVFKRLFLTRIPAIFEVLDRLYWDERRGRARAGLVSPHAVKAGDLVHRLPITIRQLEKTYDLINLKAEQLLELLGPEFQGLRSAVSAR
jgi:hypothetical protein